ncbi:MAG: CalY family protein [Actinomycetota bacterium]|nr:CalY family protein [Actinomycetota bacterium]
MQTKPDGGKKFTTARIILAGTALIGIVWAGTFASFSDSGEASSTFTAGTIDLLVGGDPDDSYAFTSLEMQNIKPGDVKYAPLTVTNSGTLNLSYTMTTSATNPDTKELRDTLALEARTVANEAACDSGGSGFNASTTTVIPSGALSAAAISARTLSAGASEVLCFKVALPSSAGDALQGATTVATFSFTGTQV